MLIAKPNINQLTTRDRHYALQCYRQIQSRIKRNQPVDKLIEKYTAVLNKSAAIVKSKKEKLPKPSRENDLPVTARWDEIANTIKHN